uniref:BHLH domain-containing protein n=1 Tax=Trichobilharzia regenti TaxID=157069 RepID=A0AA85JTZ0_TRIRE|nr:unnamed protein product [Trichobilharzia regenti]
MTECRVDDTHVPRVYSSSSGIISQNLLSGSDIVDSSTSRNDEMPSKRGRRYTIPVEIREETRRLKKQNMERRRRASVSDKMKALHSLAMEVIGINPDESQKLEKTDLLNLCYTVLERVADIAKDKPKLQARLKKLRHSLYEVTSSCPTRNAIPSSSASSSSSSSTLTSRSTSVTKKLDEFTESLHKVAIAAGNRKQDYASSSSVINKPSGEEEEYSLMNTNSSSKITRILPSSFFQSNSTNTATNNTNTSNISTATGNIPQSGQLVIDEDNKENKIPKLIIKNTFSNKSCSVVKTITTNTVTSTTPTPTTTIPLSCMHNSSSMSTTLPSISSSSSVFFVVCSTPTLPPPPPLLERMMTSNSYQHSNSEIHSWNNNNNNNQWLSSTPVGGHRKQLDSTLNNSDSGFLSGNNSHSSGSIYNRRNQCDIVSDEYSRLIGSTRPLDTPNVVHSLTDLLMNSTSPPSQKLEEEEGVHPKNNNAFRRFVFL